MNNRRINRRATKAHEKQAEDYDKLSKLYSENSPFGKIRGKKKKKNPAKKNTDSSQYHLLISPFSGKDSGKKTSEGDSKVK